MASDTDDPITRANQWPADVVEYFGPELGLPPEDRIQLQDLPAFNLAVFLGFLFLSFTVGAYVSLRLLIPVMRWQRRDTLLTESDPAATELSPS